MTRENQKPLILISTLLIMYVITGAALFLLAFLLFRFQLNERIINIGIMVIYVVSCLIGGILAGKRMKMRKFLWGLVAGAVYFGILAAGSVIMNKGFSSDTLHVGTTLVLCMASGMIGGMLS